MGKKSSKPALTNQSGSVDTYDGLLSGMVELLDHSRRLSARAVNAIMTATYWEIGRRIVELEQKGERRAAYGAQILKHLALDLTARYGRGFGVTNIKQMRKFYLSFAGGEIGQTVSGLLAESGKSQTLSDFSQENSPPTTMSTPPDRLLQALATRFPLPWSHYVRLLAIHKEDARRFYEAEAIRGGWSVRQLERQIETQFYERAMLSRNQAAILRKGQ